MLRGRHIASPKRGFAMRMESTIRSRGHSVRDSASARSAFVVSGEVASASALGSGLDGCYGLKVRRPEP